MSISLKRLLEAEVVPSPKSPIGKSSVARTAPVSIPRASAPAPAPASAPAEKSPQSDTSSDT